jgi:hypothetical protein
VGSTSVVEIIIGNNRGYKIILPHATWTALFQKRTAIEEYVQSTSPSSSVLIIQDLHIQLIKLYNDNIVKLTLRDTSVYMKPLTICFMFKLEHCVEHIYYSSCQYIHTVSEKYKEFVSLLRQTSYIYNKCDAEKLLREKYDETSLLECELLIYALDNIVHDALHDQ